MKKVQELMDLCHSYDFNYSISYQKINDYSIEIYTGYKTNYKNVFYIDGELNLKKAVKKTLEFFNDYPPKKLHKKVVSDESFNKWFKLYMVNNFNKYLQVDDMMDAYLKDVRKTGISKNQFKGFMRKACVELNYIYNPKDSTNTDGVRTIDRIDGKLFEFVYISK